MSWLSALGHGFDLGRERVNVAAGWLRGETTSPLYWFPYFRQSNMQPPPTFRFKPTDAFAPGFSIDGVLFNRRHSYPLETSRNLLSPIVCFMVKSKGEPETGLISPVTDRKLLFMRTHLLDAARVNYCSYPIAFSCLSKSGGKSANGWDTPTEA